MTAVLWTVVALLVLALIGLQFFAIRGLTEAGVRPSRAVVALRVANVVVAVGIVALAFWRWVS